MFMDSFFDRLKEERDRLGFNQEAFGAIGGVKRLAQGNYEKGDRAPDLNYLAAIAKVGADVQYIVTGVRSSAALAGDEQQLLQQYRVMDAESKRRTLAMVYGGTPPPAPKQVFYGDVGQRIEGNATFTKGVKFDMRDKK